MSKQRRRSLGIQTIRLKLVRGGGLVVTVLAFYSNNPSSNLAECYNFSCKCCLKRTKINKKEAGIHPAKTD